MSNVSVFKISDAQAKQMERDLEEQGFSLSARPYSFFCAQKPGLTVQAYTSGKLVVQGKGKEPFIEFYLEPFLGDFSHSMKKIVPSGPAHIGGDESGKGDFFGPLCVAAAFIPTEAYPQLHSLGIQDSKKITDKKILSLKSAIEKVATYEVVTLMPQKYNELYDRCKNLNTLLAWAHSAAVHAVVEKVGHVPVLIDQFASAHVLESAFRKKQLTVPLTQKTKAESDMAVACASILARAAFIKALEGLSKQAGLILPKGASSEVVRATKALVEQLGKSALSSFAKLHFKTADPYR